ncbi:MAG: tetratricopeptide repeat protein [Methanoregula sp.]|nr:tetratricopeptide repeat protein [Methanoregula sp.]
MPTYCFDITVLAYHNLHPSLPRHYRTMYNVRGLSDMALELVNREIKTDPNNPNAWYNKGVLLFKMCRYQDARNSFAQAADIDPEFAEAWYNKGIALMTLGKYLEAIRTFDKAIAINPNDREARQQRDLAQKKIMESCISTAPSSKNQTKLIK